MLLVKLNELKSYVSRWLIASLTFLYLPVVSAESESTKVDVNANVINATEATTNGAAPASDALMPMLLALLFVVFVIFAIAFVAKKMNLTPTNNNHFKLISSMSLGGRERIVIVEVQGEQHAIGVTNQSVNHLFSIENKIESKVKPMANSPMVKKLNQLFGYTPPSNGASTQLNDQTQAVEPKEKNG